MLEGIVGVVVGYATYFLTVKATAAAVAPLLTDGQLLRTLVITGIPTFITAALGGFITAHIATIDRSTYVLALAAFVFFGGIKSIITNPTGPIFHQLFYTILSTAAVVFGGWLRIRYRWRRPTS